MTSIRAFVGASAVLVASSMAVMAADLYGGRGSIKDDYVPASVQSNGCSTWYGRVDGGYSSHDRPSITQTNVDDLVRPNIQDTWSLGGGIGRYFTCNLRGDVTYDHRFQSDVNGKNANIFSPTYGDHKFGLSSDVLLFNAYYDFDLRSRFTPYIGVGLGVARNQIHRGIGVVGLEASTGGYGNPITIASNDSWHAAAALMAGFSVPLRDRLALDAGYRFLYLGNAKTGDIIDSRLNASGGPNSVDELHVHEFRVGLRLDLGGSGAACCAQPVPLK